MRQVVVRSSQTVLHNSKTCSSGRDVKKRPFGVQAQTPLFFCYDLDLTLLYTGSI